MSYCESSAHSSDTWVCIATGLFQSATAFEVICIRYAVQCACTFKDKSRCSDYTSISKRLSGTYLGKTGQEWKMLDLKFFLLPFISLSPLICNNWKEHGFYLEIIKIVRMFCNIQKLVASLLCFIKRVLLTHSYYILSSD